jgi:dephospho-CoA kinase
MAAELYTARVSSSPTPIGPYERRAAVVQPWDPRMTAAAIRVIELVHGVRPDLDIEHIGSTAVPGLPGKGIIDLGTEADPADIPAVTEALFGLGFGPQPGPNAWPPTRPMHVGSIVQDGAEYRVHFHVHQRGSGDLAKDIRFRDALRANPDLRDAYAHRKEAIAGPGGGPVDAVRYQQQKGIWILEAFDLLGIEHPVNAQFADQPADDVGDASRDIAGGEAQSATA